jgi:citrate lyase beta subunit
VTGALPVWRSLLFVPVTQRRFVDGASRRGADAIILDLEDSVAASEKERARGLVLEAAAIVSRGGADVVVRINRPLRMAVRDIEASVGPGVPALALPLNEEFRPSAEEVDHARRVLTAYDQALAKGVGAVTVDGKMIDVPVVERAQLLVERETAIAAREARVQSLG